MSIRGTRSGSISGAQVVGAEGRKYLKWYDATNLISTTKFATTESNMVSGALEIGKGASTTAGYGLTIFPLITGGLIIDFHIPDLYDVDLSQKIYFDQLMYTITADTAGYVVTTTYSACPIPATPLAASYLASDSTGPTCLADAASNVFTYAAVNYRSFQWISGSYFAANSITSRETGLALRMTNVLTTATTAYHGFAMVRMRYTRAF
jgi:hypothetical protein